MGGGLCSKCTCVSCFALLCTLLATSPTPITVCDEVLYPGPQLFRKTALRAQASKSSIPCHPVPIIKCAMAATKTTNDQRRCVSKHSIPERIHLSTHQVDGIHVGIGLKQLLQHIAMPLICCTVERRVAVLCATHSEGQQCRVKPYSHTQSPGSFGIIVP